MSAQYIADAVNKPIMTNPIPNGVVVPSKNLPTVIPINEESRLETHPIKAAPTPATWESGSMAIAVWLPKMIPIQKNEMKKQVIINHSGEWPSLVIVTTK